MELKNAVSTCLIAFFAATVVVLIAQSLDSRAASQLEPRLAQIAEELQAIRKGGGIAMGSGSGGEAMKDGLMVYYAHGNTRCPTCQTIESQAHEAVTAGFANAIKEGSVLWEVVNYEKSDGKRFVDDYAVQMPTVVLVRMKDGKAADWKRLDKVWGLVNDKGPFIEYVQAEINAMRGAGNSPTLALPLQPQDDSGPPTLNLPGTDIPLPDATPSNDDALPPLPQS